MVWWWCGGGGMLVLGGVVVGVVVVDARVRLCPSAVVCVRVGPNQGCMQHA